MSTKSSWNKIISFIKIIKVSYRHLLFFLFTGGIIKATIPFLGLYFSAQILNSLIEKNYEGALYKVMTLLSIQLIIGIIGKVCDQRIQLISENCESVVKERLGAKAYNIEFERFERQETLDALRKADLSSMGVGGMGSQIEDLYRIIEYSFSIFYSFGFTVVLFLQVDNNNKNFFNSYWSTVILILIYGIFIVAYGRVGQKIASIFNSMNKNNDHLNSVWGYLAGMIFTVDKGKDIRVFQMQEAIDKKMERLQTGLGIYLEAGKKGGFYYSLTTFLNQIASGITYIFIGMKAIYGVIPIGNVILYAGAINRVVSAFLAVSQILNQFIYRSNFLDHYTEFLESPSMSYDGTLPIEKRDDGEYVFEFHDVSFSYPDTEIEVLSHINLTFPVKGKTAIVGKNGAGKTTLIKLLCRLYEPTSGCITLNGIDIRKYNYSEYTKAFSVVFQDFKIFSLPLDENVAGDSNVSTECLWEVLEKVNLADRVKKMEQKEKSKLYHSNGEGIDVSGGEAQRLAIARALYKDAPFVILDEPTAALDPIAEAEIYENFNEMILGKTAIYISHRMSSCKFCDRIVVLEKGTISETGNHMELIENQGIYAKLYETQAKYYT